MRVPLDVAAVHCRGDTEQVVVVEVVVLEKDAVALIVGIGEFLGVTGYQIAFGGSVIVHFYLSSNLVDKCLGGVGMIAVIVVAVIRNMAYLLLRLALGGTECECNETDYELYITHYILVQ